jgi:uncharacterized RDD family membrane protein YckC
VAERPADPHAPAVSADAHGPGGVRGRLSHLAGSLSNRVLEELDADAVLERLDIEALVARIDVDGLVARLDVDALIARVDVDGLVARVDLDGLVARIDVDGVVARIDVDGVVARIDLDPLLSRIDADGLLDRVAVDRILDRVDVNRLLDRVAVDRLLDRVDVNRVLDRVDVHQLLDRVDLDRVAARLDIDALMARVDLERMLAEVDLEALVRRAGIPELVADSTGQVAGSALDLGRRQLVGLDVGVGRGLQRLLGRDPDALPAGPTTLVADSRARIEAPPPDQARTKARFEVSGFYAGPVSRVASLAGDVALATAAFTAGMGALAWILSTLLGVTLGTGERSGPLWLAAFVGWLFLYWWVSTAVAGRTPIMTLAGLRIVARDGRPLRPRQALVRTLVLPVSLVAFGLGGAWMVVDRERRGLHDLLAGSTVVYDWGGRPAELPTPLAKWIAEHGRGT